ncbi:hypothetical protein BCUN_0375 [Bifidobacterium cuniculi]|uniref:Uncharacterized protein n=1 Tax=Bifidobacterium cuniculi TaxID=1688 RepID=A0A087B4C9_9BIFI|nr:hypothetical protein BCUN_0375 [Bifidobacterium cuniculi]
MAAGGWSHATMIDYYDMGHRAAEAPVAGQAVSDYLTGK